MDGLGVDDVVGGSNTGARICRNTPCGQFFGKMVDTNGFFPAENEGSLDDVLQFPNVPRPIVGHEMGEGFG